MVLNNKREWNKANLKLKYKIIYNKLIKEIQLLPYTLNVNFELVDKNENPFISNKNGYYDNSTKTIYLNKDVVMIKDETYIHSILMHELTHAIQNYKIDNKLQFPNEKDNIELLDICINQIRCNINFCDVMHKSGNLHIFPINEIYSKTYIFYMLNIAEREAFSSQFQILYGEYLEEAYAQFNNLYKTNLNNYEIDKLIDKCYLNLFYNKTPSGNYSEKNLQATIMYDLAHIARYCYITDSNSKELETELNAILNHAIKENVLAKYGYVIYNNEPVNNLLYKIGDIINNIENLGQLSEQEQIANPKLMLYFYFKYGDSIFKYIKNKDAFFYELKKYDNVTISLPFTDIER